MEIKHGIGVSEKATSLQQIATVNADVPVVIGVAPVHLATDPVPANVPVYCNDIGDAQAQLGYCSDFANYDACEAMYAYFYLYNVAPVVFINVLDITKHKKAGTQTALKLTNKVARITEPVIVPTLKVKDSTNQKDLTKDVDYTALHDDDGNLVITLLDSDAVKNTANLAVTYEQVDPTAVTKQDIIGGEDTTTGIKKGIEAIENVFPKLRIVPGILLAPKYSMDNEVAMILNAKGEAINGLFQAMVYADLPADDTLSKYSDVPAYKNEKNFVDKNLMIHWPKAKIGDKILHMGTLNAALTYYIDATEGEDVPYISPSNHVIKIDGTCLDDGTDVLLSIKDANVLNGEGITTATNFVGGWRSWGNRTACYPANLDPKDNFNPLRRMANWISATLVLSYFSKVDGPIRPRWCEQITDTINIWLAGLTADEKLLGGRVEFRCDENPNTSLINGHVKFHLYLGYLVPAEYVEFVLEYDVSYLQQLFNNAQ